MSGYSDLGLLVRFRPLSEKLPGPRYANQYGGGWSSPFSASWTSTVELLAREIAALKPRQAILEIDLPENGFRITDGLPKANARAATPGVILSLTDTVHGSMRYPSHHFHTWQDNVRALALALEALRKVDRYGITGRGQQYAGWRQIEAGSAAPSAERGRRIIAEHGGVTAALKATHPDHGGDAAAFADVQAAREAGA